MKAVILALGLCACDGQPLHRIDPTWSRMMEQPRANAYGASSAFDDGAVMRAPPPGTRAIDAPEDDAPAPAITRDAIERGRERFDTLCAACHGRAGDGDSVVARKMTRKPPSFTEPRLLALSARDLHDIATHGYGLMPGYATKLDARERWDVAFYVLALRRSRHAIATELPRAMRGELEESR